jgi:hypothetical protein
MGPYLYEGALFAPVPALLYRCEANTYNGTWAKVRNGALARTYISYFCKITG